MSIDRDASNSFLRNGLHQPQPVPAPWHSDNWLSRCGRSTRRKLITLRFDTWKQRQSSSSSSMLHGLSPPLFVFEPSQPGRADVTGVAAKRSELDADCVPQRFENSWAHFVANVLQELPTNFRIITAERHRSAKQHRIGIDCMNKRNNSDRQPIRRFHDALASHFIAPFGFLGNEPR